LPKVVVGGGSVITIAKGGERWKDPESTKKEMVSDEGGGTNVIQRGYGLD